MLKSKKSVSRTIIRIPDDLWYEIEDILPDEKPDNTIGRPIVPYRKVQLFHTEKSNCSIQKSPIVPYRKVQLFHTEKSNCSIQKSPIVPYRKVLDGIMFILRTGCQWKMLPKQRIWFWFNMS